MCHGAADVCQSKTGDSAQDMYEAVTEEYEQTDIVIMTAAVADYRPAQVSTEKVKKKEDDMSIPLTRTKDILATLGASKTHQSYAVFPWRHRTCWKTPEPRLQKKNLDMIVANNLKVAGAGFGTDTNVITLIANDMEKSCR